MPTWPASLPQRPLVDGHTETPPNVLLRTSMDSGPPKVRRRSTAGVRTFSMRFFLSLAQVQTLDDFFWTTCQAGALPFDWVHPRTGAAATFRWVAPPKYAADTGRIGWLVALELEIVP